MSSPDKPTTPPDVPNLRKAQLESAADRADQAVDTLAPAGDNPAASVGRTMTAAWVSDPTATNTITDITGIGGQIKSAFTEAASHLRALAAAQPAMVPFDDPRAHATPAHRGVY